MDFSIYNVDLYDKVMHALAYQPFYQVRNKHSFQREATKLNKEQLFSASFIKGQQQSELCSKCM